MHNFRYLIPLLLLIGMPFAWAEDTQEVSPPVAKGFLRDVLQPIGIPLVSLFHTIRESPFLNATIEGENPIESVGNIFLIPGQYLFCGKKIAFGSEVIVSQAFDYRDYYWIKTTLSLIAFPLFEPLGIACKALSFLSTEVRERHEKAAQQSLFTHTSSHLDEYRQMGIDSFYDKDTFIPCQKHKRPILLSEQQKIEIAALDAITTLLEKNNILHWIDCGSCLGAYRYGGFIPWDSDIDLGILEQDHDNVRKLLSTLDKEQYQVQDWSSYEKPKTLLKLYVKATKNFIDIYHYKIDPQNQTITYIFTYEDSPFPESWKKAEMLAVQCPLSYKDLFPLKKAQFDGLLVWAPNQIVNFLHTKYGNNLDPSMVWNEKLSIYERVIDHPYWEQTGR